MGISYVHMVKWYVFKWYGKCVVPICSLSLSVCVLLSVSRCFVFFLAFHSQDQEQTKILDFIIAGTMIKAAYFWDDAKCKRPAEMCDGDLVHKAIKSTKCTT